MVTVPPPQGMTEVDYEAIEAAVTETVRGRWFLNEFARRNRLAETRLLLDAMARLETTVAAQQTMLPSADPSIRMLVQRIKEIAEQLDGLARDMRGDGVADRHWSAVEHQSRAVSGLMRSATPPRPAAASIEARPEPAEVVPRPGPRLPRAELPPSLAPGVEPADPRLDALSGLDGLTLAKKLALFS
jgi:hypothetical protein